MRDAVLTLLANDTELAAIGAAIGAGFTVVANFSVDQRPNNSGAFLVIVWRTTDFDVTVQANTFHHFEVYAHIPVAVSTDFVSIDRLLDRCDAIFAGVEDTPVAGADGWQLDYVAFHGRGIDTTDEGYQTICRSASYAALGSPTS